MAAVKIGVSRQVVIPKKIHDELGLAPGDYLEVKLQKGRVVLTPNLRHWLIRTWSGAWPRASRTSAAVVSMARFAQRTR
jgi:AbrB family looped-hinge helix DNA binding protein